ncbi:MAG TPA: hypothetical protein VKT28_10040 [Puia sp.]|nr:hypothetical protein [Puia sp.]
MKTATLTEQQNYHASITANASAKKVFEEICKVNEWWTAKFEGSAKKLNDVFTVHFGETFVTFKIVDVIPNEIIVWLVTDCHLPWLRDKKEWNETKVVFEILQERESTKIDLTHVGLTPEVECYHGCEKGWDFFFRKSLLKLITTGKGMADTPIAER